MSVPYSFPLFRRLVCLIGLVLWTASAEAQLRTAAITGTVTDGSGGVLPGATVEALVAGETVASAVTGPDGRYRIELAAPVQQQLRVRRDGFADQTVDVQPAPGGATRDFRLRLAALADTIVVTASRTRESRAASPDSMTVFTAGDIADLGSASLADVLARVSGLHVEANGREGALSSLFSRGGESDYNLVLIDGVRVNGNGGQFDFSRVAGAEIERVEIVRGAQSALYGSDAIGSVVQVFTRRSQPADRPQLFAAVEGGSFASRRGDVRLLGGARRRVDYQAGLAYRGTDGAFAGLSPEKDRFDQTAFDGTIGVIIGQGTTLRAGLRHSDASGRAVGQLAYGVRDTGTTYQTRDLSWHVDVGHRLSARVTQRASVTYFGARSLSADTVGDPAVNVYAVLEGVPGAIFPASPRLVRLLDRGTFDAMAGDGTPLGPGRFLAYTAFGVGDYPFTSRNRFRRPAFKYQADVTWRGHQVLTAGYEYERESDPLSDGVRVTDNAYFIQQQFGFADRWFASLGARVNDNSRYGTNLTPKLSAGVFLLPYRPAPVSSVKVFANFGRGIKNPTFDELFDGAFTDGNPGLQPERARTVDVGAELTFDGQRWLGRATYFDNRYRDQVAYRSTSFSGPDGLPDFLNIDGSKAVGLELEAGLQRPVGGLTAGATYALVDTEVVTSVSSSAQFQPGQPLLRRPKHSGTLHVAWTRGRGKVMFDVRRVGNRHDSAFLFMSALDFTPVDITVNRGYTLLGLGGEVRVRDGVRVFVRLDNLTGAVYESALGFPGLPRAAVVGGRFQFGG